MTLPAKPRNAHPGNKEVIDMLERWLERAKQGEIGYAVVVACMNEQLALANQAGSLKLAMSANYGLDIAKTELMIKVASRSEQPFEPDNSMGADRACYNMTLGPSCFDFICWLVLAEMNRRRNNAPAPLKVGFVMDDSDEERNKHEALRRKFYEGVIYPSLALVGAVRDEASDSAPQMTQYTFRHIVEAANKGEEVPLLKPSVNADWRVNGHLFQGYPLGKKRPVTITLREAGWQEYRNSNLEEWLKVADHLKAQGERVIFVRDTAKAFEKIPGHETYHEASIDLNIRMSLYEHAKCNLFVSNGPWTLSVFSTKPWLMFVELNNTSSYFPDHPQFWDQWHKLDPRSEERFPWSKKTQRIIWKRDDASTIIKAWEEMKPLIEAEDANSTAPASVA